MSQQDGVVVDLRREELSRVAAIEALVFPEPLNREELEALWEMEGVRYLAIREGAALAAYFGFSVHGPIAHVISNATDPAFRRRGYGGRILVEAEPFARAMGARWFLGEVRASNGAQRSVLRRIGWQEIGRCPHFFGNGEDAYVVFRCLPEEAKR
ncbi:MAG: GNAT family N-acetyltransferase [Thermaerobacter sp.]|nr:GNAT family N-acetyltransferase [Thermaerobacter sp.]